MPESIAHIKMRHQKKTASGSQFLETFYMMDYIILCLML